MKCQIGLTTGRYPILSIAIIQRGELGYTNSYVFILIVTDSEVFVIHCVLHHKSAANNGKCSDGFFFTKAVKDLTSLERCSSITRCFNYRNMHWAIPDITCDLIEWNETHVGPGPKRVLDTVIKSMHHGRRKRGGRGPTPMAVWATPIICKAYVYI